MSSSSNLEKQLFPQLTITLKLLPLPPGILSLEYVWSGQRGGQFDPRTTLWASLEIEALKHRVKGECSSCYGNFSDVCGPI